MSRFGPGLEERNTYSYETERLVVELPRAEDAEILYSLIGGEDRREICATLVWDGPESVSVSEEWVEGCHSKSFGDWGFHWVLRDRAGAFGVDAGTPLGAIGTRPRETPGRADVGYWLGKPYWGNGIMTEALHGLLDYGFSTLDLAKIEAEVFTHNIKGLRLVERLGMKQEGTIRRTHRKYGEWVDSAIYGILLEEWRQTSDSVGSIHR